MNRLVRNAGAMIATADGMIPQRRSAAGPGAKALATLLVAIALSTFGISQLSVIRDVNPAGSVLTDIGADVASIPDLDGDGVADGDGITDVAAGLASTSPSQGALVFFSGATGAILRQIVGPLGFGASLAAVGDWNGDGVGDVVAGNPGFLGTPQQSSVHAYSGATGLLIDAFVPTGSAADMGFAVASAGDVHSDGFVEVAVGAPGLVIPAGTGFPSSAGRVVLLSAPGFASGTAEFGTGCPAVNGRVPRLLTIGGPPSVLSGNPRFGLVVGSAVAGQPMAWLLGTSTTNWQGSSLPLDLGVYGLSGCQLIISPDLLVPSATHAGAGGVGTAVLPVPIPIDPNLYGFAVGVQAFIQNPSGALGAMTAALIVSAQ